MLGRVQIKEGANHVGQAAQRHGEDDRHNAGHIHLDRNVAGLAAVHLAADHPLGVLYRDAALGVGQNNHKDNRNNGKHQQNRQQDIVAGSLLRHRQQPLDHCDHTGPVGYNTGEDQQRNAVADALGINLVAHPGNQLAAGREAEHNDNGGEDAGKAIGILQRAGTAQDEVVGNRQHQADAGAHIVGDAGQLAAAFLPFFGKVFQVGDGNRQQLYDNGSVDIRLNAERKDRALAQGRARHHVQVGQHAAGCEHIGQGTCVDIRNRNGTAQAKDNQNHKRKQ